MYALNYNIHVFSATTKAFKLQSLIQFLDCSLHHGQVELGFEPLDRRSSGPRCSFNYDPPPIQELNCPSETASQTYGSVAQVPNASGYFQVLQLLVRQ
jgi:hypothetical protein